MAYWQRLSIASAKSWDNGGTIEIELPENGLLGSLQVHAYRAGVTDAFATLNRWRLIDYISKVEVLGDESTIIKSVTGEVAKGLTFADGGGGAPDQEFNYGSSTKRAHFMINFGRRLFDRKYLLDLSKFKNVKLKLTNTGTSTLFGGNWNVSVMGYFLRDVPASISQGYLRTEEWQSWTTVQDETKTLKIPAAQRIRRIGFHVLPAFGTNANADTQSYNVLDSIKVYLRSRALVMMDESLRDLWYENYFHDGRERFAALEPYHSNGVGVKTGLGQTLAKAMGQMPQGGSPGANTVAVEPGNDGASQKLLRTGTDNYSWIMMGLALENLAILPFNQDDEDPSTWLDPKADSEVEIEAHTANSASADNGTIKVVLDRLVVP